MKKHDVLPLMLKLCLFAVTACEVPTSVSEETSSSQSLYFNSFESMADTVGWRGFGALQLRDEAPAEGGLQSALVSGGCPYPHSAFEFTVARESRLVLRAWGKNLGIGGGIGGGITLESTEAGRQVSLFVSEPEWTRYQSQDTLQVHRGQRLRLTMNAGGFAASAMLVDLLEIKEVE